MKDSLIFLCMAVASAGFAAWYAISSSLRLPVRYQVMYDANPPYVYRVLRRRTLAALIYTVIPWMLIRWTSWFGKPSLHDLNIFYTLNEQVVLYTGIGMAAALLLSWLSTRSDSSLEIFPEVRVRFWRPYILLISGSSWILYVVCLEFFYRGLLLQSLRLNMNDLQAVAASTALYGLTQYFKLSRLTLLGFFWGVIACIMTLQTQSLLPATLTHITLSLSTEWLSIRHHREMYARHT